MTGPEGPSKFLVLSWKFAFYEIIVASQKNKFLLVLFSFSALLACNNISKTSITNDTNSDKTSVITFNGDTSTAGMVLIKGGDFMMGGDNNQADKDEYPKHKVILDDFYLDAHEVTNAQFKAFVDATGYVTTAEKKPDWEELKKQLPPNTPKPDDSQLVASSLVFTPPSTPVDLNNYSLWWSWTPGANWKHPNGPNSDIKGKDNYPVVHISWDDAIAYCKWVGKRLPTEAEWEYAARGGLESATYPWGGPYTKSDRGCFLANFKPSRGDYAADEALYTVEAKSYEVNGYGLYNMAGNVSEWTDSSYDAAAYEYVSTMNPTVGDLKNKRKVIRGGSWKDVAYFLQVSTRDYEYADSARSYIGFRTVQDYMGTQTTGNRRTGRAK